MHDINHLEDKIIKDNFSDTLPNVSLPSIGESLIGLLLRLDNINGFYPGTLIKSALPKEKVSLLRLLDDIEEIEANINTLYIANLLNTQQDYIERTKISYLREKVFGQNNDFTKEIIGIDQLKICPICIREWRIPLIFFIKGIDTCLFHGVKLLRNCICKRRIELFYKKDSLICAKKRCNRSYLAMNTIQDNEVIKTESYEQSIVNSLITGAYMKLNKDKINTECLAEKIQFITRMKDAAKKYINDYFGFKIAFFEYGYSFGEGIDDKIDIVSLIKRLDRIHMPFYKFLELPSPSNENISVEIDRLEVNETHDFISGFKWDENDWWLYQFSQEINNMLNYKHAFSRDDLIKSVLDSNRTIKGQVQVNSEWITLCFEFKVFHRNKREFFIYI